MGETAKTGNNPKKSWFKGLKAEFNKIVWPTKQNLVKETGTVLIVAIVLGAAVAVFDFILQYGMNILIG